MQIEIISNSVNSVSVPNIKFVSSTNEHQDQWKIKRNTFFLNMCGLLEWNTPIPYI
jgi:hypothetical protein